jgi:hypothetical protein
MDFCLFCAKFTLFQTLFLWYNNRKDSGYYTDSNALFLAAEAATEKEGYYTINQERIYGIITARTAVIIQVQTPFFSPPKRQPKKKAIIP